MTTEITALDNGSYMIHGEVVVKDAAGNTYPLAQGEDVFLCRCGQSSTKPLCDGSPQADRLRRRRAGHRGRGRARS